jgi:hypothetical protein
MQIGRHRPVGVKHLQREDLRISQRSEKRGPRSLIHPIGMM